MLTESVQYVDSLLARLDTARVPRERAELLVQIAREVRALGDGSQALDALIEAWRADPTCEAILAPLETLARAEGRWPEVFAATEQLVAKERDPARAVALSDAMVRWLTREVPKPDLAKHYLERIRAIDATHWALHLYQAAVSREHGDYRRELESLDRAVLSAKRADDRASIHLLMAARYGEERSLNPVEAKKHFDAVLALEPRSLDALRGLEALHTRAEDWPALAEVLEREVEAHEDDDAKVGLLMRAAEIHEKRFLKPEAAAERLERAFVLDPANTEALASLERCYRAARAWPQLVSVFERSAVMNDDPAAKRARLEAIAEVHESRIGDLESARRAWDRLAALVPADPAPVTELARLSEKIGDVEATVKYKARLAELSADPAARARAHLAIAQLLSTSKGEPARTRAHLEEAVALDPSLAAAWNVLLWMAKDDGDHARVARYLEERATAEQGPRLRAQLFTELAELRAKELGDEAGAIKAYEAAREAEPQNEAAARALLQRYVAEERWEDAAELHEVAIGAADRDGDQEARFALLRVGRTISVALGHAHVAFASALAAYELRPTSVEAQAELVEECARAKSGDHAAGAEALARAKDALESIARTQTGLPADALATLAELLVGLGETKQAYALYDAALVAAPTHKAALAGLAALCALENDVVVSTALRRRLAQTLEDEGEKFALLVECGDALVAAGKLELAVDAYEEARAVRPQDRPLLHVLLGHTTTLERWADLSKILRAVADSDDDKGRRAKTVATMAQLAVEKLGDKDAALALDEEALDLDASRLEAFERIVTTLTERRDWGALEAAYGRMLARSRSADPKLQRALYHQAGLVCRDRLGDRARAIGYFQAAAQLDPADAQVQAILRELLEITGRVEDAMAVALERVRGDPLATEGWAPLVDVALQAGALDRAWCAASVMEHLGVLDEAHAGFYRAHPPTPLADAGGKLEDAAALRALLHPELDPSLTALFEIVAPAAIELQLARLSLRQRMSHPGPSLPRPRTPDATTLLTALVARGAEIFGFAPPRLFVRRSPGRALAAAPTRPPSLLVSVEALVATPDELLPFLVGKHLFELTPPLLARAICPTVSELSALVTMAVNATVGDAKKEPLRAHLSATDVAALAHVIGEAQARGGELDVKRWSRLADLSAARAGLLFAGDLKLARAALAREPQSPGDLPLRDQMRELVLFMMSDGHAALRKALGVGLGGV